MTCYSSSLFEVGEHCNVIEHFNVMKDLAMLIENVYVCRALSPYEATSFKG